MTLRESLAQTIINLTKAIDYWSEQTVRGKEGSDHYVRLVKIMEDLKSYIIEEERKSREELRLSSRSNGGLHETVYDWVEELQREQTNTTRD